jgi:hypothetical protein
LFAAITIRVPFVLIAIVNHESAPIILSPWFRFSRASLDVGGVVRLQNQRPFAYLSHPVGGKLRLPVRSRRQTSRLQKAPCPFDAGDRLGHAVGDGECGLETHSFVNSSL